MLNIQSGISRNPASFKARIIVLNQENDNQHISLPDNLTDEVQFDETKNSTSNLTQPIDDENDEYTEEDYKTQKAFLEQKAEVIEKKLNDVATAKPVKKFYKFALGSIAVAMGFVSMKWSTLGAWKIAEDTVNNPTAQRIVKGMVKPLKDGVNTAADFIKNSGVSKKITDTVTEGIKLTGEKFNETKAAKTINNITEQAKKTNLYKQTAKLVEQGYEKVSNGISYVGEKTTGLTKAKIKSGVSNFFGVSGGVTASVEVIQNNKKAQPQQKV